jgi:hypothetical protein
MKKFASALAILAFVLCTVFAIERYLLVTAHQRALEEARAELVSATKAFQANPLIFGEQRGSGRQDLKSVAQAASGRSGVPLMFLSEAERELSEGVRERTLVCRTANVKLSALVAFLSDLEASSKGARLKEIRLKQSPENSNLFSEAESVLSIKTISPKTPRPEGVTE